MRSPVIPGIFLLLLSISSAVILPNMVSLLPDKAVLEERLSAQSGLQLTLNGDVRLRFLPRPQIIMTNVDMRADADTGLKAAVVVVSLAPLDFLRGKLGVRGVDILRADMALELRDGAGGLMDTLLAAAHPGVRFIDMVVRVRGLDRFDRDREAVLAGVSAQVAARGPRDDFVFEARRIQPGKPDAIFKARLGDIGAPRQDLSVSLSFAANEQAGFDGFLGQNRNGWRADGELRLDSNAMVSDLVQTQLPIRLAAPARRIAFSGLVQFDSAGVRSENLEITALDTIFQSRLALAWPRAAENKSRAAENKPRAAENKSRAADEMPRLTGRLSTGVINLDHITITDTIAAGDSALASIWQAFERDLSAALRIEATRFDIGGESGQNLLLAFNWRDKQVDVQRFSLDLPFRSLFLANGMVDLRAPQPAFEGSFSTRSTDALAAFLWLSEIAGVDSARVIETLDESGLQRVSLVGDIAWSPAKIRLSAVSGRLGDDRLSADVNFALSRSWQGRIGVEIERLDLADWGVVAGSLGRPQNFNTALLQPLNKSLQMLLSTADAERNLRLDIATKTLFSGVNNFGAARFQAQLIDQRVRLQELALEDFNAVTLTLSGAMNYEANLPYGRVSARIKGEGGLPQMLVAPLPVAPVETAQLDLLVDLHLTAPDAPDWPNAKLKGRGTFGEIDTAFTLSGPARQISFDAAGQKLDLTMQGSAENIGQLVNMAQPYDSTQRGSLSFSIENQSSDLAQISSVLVLDEDRLSLQGTMRRGVAGQRVDGSLSFRLGDALPFLMATKSDRQVPAQGTVQINSDPENIAFSGLEATLGEGTISGEGVISLEAALPKLNANIKADKLDLGWLLPRFGSDGWSDAPMRWSAFARADIDIELAATQSVVADLLVDTAAARIKLLDGVLEAPQISGTALGGDFQAALLAEGGSLNPYFNLEMRLTNMRPDALLTAIYAAQPADLVVGGTVTLSGRGTSARSMMASLDGAMQFDLAPGRLNFVDLTGFAARANAADFDGAAAPLVAASADGPGTEFARGVGLVEIEDGQALRATMDFIFAPGTHRDGRIDGQFDFVSRDMLVDLTLYPAGDTRRLAWRLSGDVMAPDIVLDAAEFDRMPPPQEGAAQDASINAPAPN